MTDSSAHLTQPSAEVNSAHDASAASGQPEPIETSIFRARVVPLIALVMVLGLLGLLAFSLFAPDSTRPRTGRVNASGALITENGRSAADFSVTTFDGERFVLSEQRGKIVIINFWASWCPPCREETPLLTTAAGQLDPDVVLIGIDVWDERGEAEQFVESFGVNYLVASDDGSIAVDYGITGVPETFVVDANGKIVARLPGPVTSLQQLRDMVAEAR